MNMEKRGKGETPCCSACTPIRRSPVFPPSRRAPRAFASMRKLANPPGAIKLVLEAVCVVLDIKPAKVGH